MWVQLPPPAPLFFDPLRRKSGANGLAATDSIGSQYYRVTQTVRSWVRNGLINAVDTLIDVSGEDANSIIWKADEDAGDAGD